MNEWIRHWSGACEWQRGGTAFGSEEVHGVVGWQRGGLRFEYTVCYCIFFPSLVINKFQTRSRRVWMKINKCNANLGQFGLLLFEK